MAHCRYICNDREKSVKTKEAKCIHEGYCRTFLEKGGKFIKSDVGRDRE